MILSYILVELHNVRSDFVLKIFQKSKENKQIAVVNEKCIDFFKRFFLDFERSDLKGILHCVDEIAFGF